MLWRLEIYGIVKHVMQEGSIKGCWKLEVSSWSSSKKILEFLDSRKYPNKFMVALDGINKMNKPGREHQETTTCIYKPIISIKKLGKARFVGWQTLPTHEIICAEGLRTHNSGKTNTAICHLSFANKIFREFWNVHEDKEQKIELHKFDLGKDVIYDPNPQSLDTILEGKYFQTIDLTEGMGAAINLRSMDRDVIKLGIKAYRMRAHNNIIIYEYQVTKRPPALLMERFNVWIQKMNRQWAVLSMPSEYYRKTDTLYLKKLDEVENNNKVSKWFTNRITNPNFLTRFKAPKLSKHAQEIFDKHREEADKRMIKMEEIQSGLPKRFLGLVETYWNEINGPDRTGLDITDLRTELAQAGLRDTQINVFMRKYNEYDSVKKLENRIKKPTVDEIKT